MKVAKQTFYIEFGKKENKKYIFVCLNFYRFHFKHSKCTEKEMYCARKGEKDIYTQERKEGKRNDMKLHLREVKIEQLLHLIATW